MNRISFLTLILCLGLAACASTTPDANEAEAFDYEVKAAVSELKRSDPSLVRWFDSAHGYAVFPSIVKGGLIVGGGTGRGYVFKGGQHIGFVRVTQGTFGLQAGGQAFRQVIFFENERTLHRLTRGNFEFNAQVSAIAVEKGASADADYRDGVAVFTMPTGGLMAEATVGGQKFDYEAKYYGSQG